MTDTPHDSGDSDGDDALGPKHFPVDSPPDALERLDTLEGDYAPVASHDSEKPLSVAKMGPKAKYFLRVAEEENSARSQENSRVDSRADSRGETSRLQDGSRLSPRSKGFSRTGKPRNFFGDTRELNSDDIAVAAVYVEDALYLRDIKHRTDAAGLKLHRLYWSKWFSVLMLLFCLLFPLLSQLQDIGAASPRVLISLELLCIAAFFGHQMLRKNIVLKDEFWNLWVIISFSVMAACATDAIVALGLLPHLRPTRVLRVYFLVNYSRDARSQIIQISKTVWSMVLPFATLLLVVYIQTVLAVILFAHDDYLTDFFDAYLNMLTVLNRGNFPDIMFPAMDVGGLWAAVFFAVCMIFTFYFVLNLLLALVYGTYRAAAVDTAKNKWRTRQQALVAAFEQLDTQRAGQIDRPTWKRLFIEMQRGKVPEDQLDLQANLYFSALVPNGNHVQFPEFIKLTEKLSHTFQRVVEAPNSTGRVIVARYWNSKWGQNLRVVIILLNVSVFTFGISDGTVAWDLWTPPYVWVIDTLFLTFHVVDACIYLWLKGVRLALTDKYRRFTLFIVSLSFLGKVIIEAILIPLFKDETKALYRLAVLFRLIRLLRLLVVSDKVRSVIRGLLRVLISLGPIFLAINVLYYSFGVIGMHLFQDTLLEDNVPNKQLDYVKRHYGEYINFQTLGNTYITLFHLMVVNNWFVTFTAAVSVTSRWHFLFFLSWFFVIVINAIPLFVSYTLESVRHMLKEMESNKTKDKTQNIVIEGGKEANFQMRNDGDADAGLELFKRDLDDF